MTQVSQLSPSLAWSPPTRKRTLDWAFEPPPPLPDESLSASPAYTPPASPLPLRATLRLARATSTGAVDVPVRTAEDVLSDGLYQGAASAEWVPLMVGVKLPRPQQPRACGRVVHDGRGVVRACESASCARAHGARAIHLFGSSNTARMQRALSTYAALALQGPRTEALEAATLSALEPVAAAASKQCAHCRGMVYKSPSQVHARSQRTSSKRVSRSE